jgi:hypothetical protein
MISQIGRGTKQTAAAGLRTPADPLPPGAISAMAVVVKAASVPDRLPDVLRSHTWMHAPERIVYRQAHPGYSPRVQMASPCGRAVRAVCRGAPPQSARPGGWPTMAQDGTKTPPAPPSTC